jgi:hypothetical protein
MYVRHPFSYVRMLRGTRIPCHPHPIRRGVVR